jgi:hypothetical protein
VRRIWLSTIHWIAVTGYLSFSSLPWLVAQQSGNLDLDAALRGVASASPASRSEALYNLERFAYLESGRPELRCRDLGVYLVRAHPSEAEKIKLSLTAGLELQGRYVQETHLRSKAGQRDASLTEDDTDTWANLICAITQLRDPGAINGLLLAIASGGMARTALADLAPLSIPAVIGKASDPDESVRAAAAGVLGEILRRSAVVAANPGAADAARQAIVAALDDSSPGVRSAAIVGLGQLRDDPEIKKRLQAIASNDPAVESGPEGKSRYPVRETVGRVLAEDREPSYFVVRAGDTGECRVQQKADAPQAACLMGPSASREEATLFMCTHLDAAGGKDPTLCQAAYPQNACK